jgi:hypothetical protein
MRLKGENACRLGREKNSFRITVQPQVRVFPSRDSARTEKREGRCLRSPCRSIPCTGDRQLGFWGASTRLPEHHSGKHLPLPGGMTREAGQGSGSSERMGGYGCFISILFYVLQIIYVSYVHVYCFVFNHEFISFVLSYYIMTCLISVHASNMLHLIVLILQSCCLCCYLFIINCSVSSYAYYIYMIHMFYVLTIHTVMDIFDIMISMINHLLYVIIIMLIYRIKMIWKMPIFLTVITWSSLIQVTTYVIYQKIQALF